MYLSKYSWPFNSRFSDFYDFWAQKRTESDKHFTESLTVDHILGYKYSSLAHHQRRFEDFWDLFRCTSPHKAVSIEEKEFRCLTKDEKWSIRCCLHGWAKRVAFQQMTPETNERLVALYNKVKTAAFSALINAESKRLQCDANYVMPLLVLDLGLRQTDFADLPKGVFHSVLDKLDLYDVSITACVCKKWRVVGKDYLKRVTKVEHSVATHLTRRRRWTDFHGDFSGHLAIRDWETVGYQLSSWVIGLSDRVDTLMLTFLVELDNLMLLLKECKHLKHLMFLPPDSLQYPAELKRFGSRLCQVNLQTLILLAPDELWDEEDIMDMDNGEMRLVLPDSLQILSSTLRHEESSQFPRTCVFIDKASVLSRLPNLIVYEDGMYNFPSVLEIREICEFKLEYLRIGDDEEEGIPPLDPVELCTMLERCPRLRVLILEAFLEVDDYTVNLIRLECQQIEVAWIQSAQENAISPDSLRRWELSMLRTYRSSLEDINVVVYDDVSRCQEAAPGFTYQLTNSSPSVPNKYFIWHPFMRRLLSLKF